MNLLLAAICGLMLAGAVTIAIEVLAPRLNTVSDVQEALNVPLLGIAPRIPFLEAPLPLQSLPPAFEESLRTLRTHILLSYPAALRTLAVTSSVAGEGKTLVASSLAMSMAIGGRRVLLIDADMRRPRVHDMFGVPVSPGLSELLAGSHVAESAIRASGVPGLSVLPAGIGLTNPGDALDGDTFRLLVGRMSVIYDLVIIDSPPVTTVADASIIANVTSAVLFVVSAGSTSREMARVAVDRIASSRASVIGVVLNKADLRQLGHYYPYYEHPSQYVDPALSKAGRVPPPPRNV
jgi:capsular exopolysaccharide synthesis family protein